MAPLFVIGAAMVEQKQCLSMELDLWLALGGGGPFVNTSKIMGLTEGDQLPHLLKKLISLNVDVEGLRDWEAWQFCIW